MENVIMNQLMVSGEGNTTVATANGTYGVKWETNIVYGRAFNAAVEVTAFGSDFANATMTENCAPTYEAIFKTVTRLIEAREKFFELY